MMFPKPLPKFKEPRPRFSSMPKKRKEERRSGRERDPAYLARVRQLPCYVGVAYPKTLHVCGGVTEADHQGPRPLGRKSHDREAVPMCQLAHYQRTNYVGFFKNYSAEDMRRFCSEAIAWTQKRLGGSSITTGGEV